MNGSTLCSMQSKAVLDGLGRPIVYYGKIPYYVGSDAQGFIHNDSVGEYIFFNQTKRYWKGVVEKIDEMTSSLLGNYGFFLLKPDVYQGNFEEDIISSFVQFGGVVSLKKDVVMTEQTIVSLYPYFFDLSFFQELVQYLISGKSCAVLVKGVISPENLFQFRRYIRERYCKDPMDPLHNLIHVPDTVGDMLRTVQIFFSSGELTPFL
jgi:hypothetical protein